MSGRRTDVLDIRELLRHIQAGESDRHIAKPVFDRQIVTSRNPPSVMPGIFFARSGAVHLNNRAKEHPAQSEL